MFLSFIIGFVLKTALNLLCTIFIVLSGLKIYLTFTKVTCTCKVDLRGKIILVTGGNGGIGFETAKILAKRGARIVIASRNVTKSKEAVQVIIDATGNPKIECKPLDLSKLSSVKQFAEDFNNSYDRLDVLINNAGMGDVEQQMTEDKIEKTMHINHVGPTYLTKLLLDKLIASKPSRVIFVSSHAHLFHKFDQTDLIGEKPRTWLPRFANSKLCNVLTARALSKILPKGVTANSLHPGTAKTRIFERFPGSYQKICYFIIDNFMKTPEECSQTTVHLASAPSLANVTGEYFYDCKIQKPSSLVTDELAEQVWKSTLRLIEDRSRTAAEHTYQPLYEIAKILFVIVISFYNIATW